MRLEVTLTAEDVERATAAAEGWGRANRDAQTRNLRVGSQSDEETDFVGVLGEIAFGKCFGIEPDLSIGARRGGADFVVNGVRIDVKGTFRTSSRTHLLATLNKAETADVDAFVLVQIDRATLLAKVAGWARSSDLLREDRIVDLGHGPGYGIQARELRPVSAEMTCGFCAAPGPRYDLKCDACVVRKIREMPDRARRGQVLEAVRMRRGQGAMDRIRKLVEESWT